MPALSFFLKFLKHYSVTSHSLAHIPDNDQILLLWQIVDPFSLILTRLIPFSMAVSKPVSGQFIIYGLMGIWENHLPK